MNKMTSAVTEVTVNVDGTVMESHEGVFIQWIFWKITCWKLCWKYISFRKADKIELTVILEQKLKWTRTLYLVKTVG